VDPSRPADAGSTTAKALGAAVVAFAVAAFHWLYLLPPRGLGSSDPDRFYHLGLSRIIAASGLPRVLPQVEDLGWGGYFPDKEFLFHALTGSAWAVGGADAVLALVPAIGLGIALCLYSGLCRTLRPGQATLLVLVGLAGTAGFVYRLSLLRPHLLAIFIFCLLVLAVLRSRPRLAGLAAAMFVLAYHAFYIVLVVAAVAWLLRRQPGIGRHTWSWCLAGLAVGLVVNPYFPSNLSMGWFTLRLGLGLESMTQFEQGGELAPLSRGLMLAAYGFLPATLLVTAAGIAWRKPAASAERTALLFLFALSAVFTLLGLRSMRAMEYAVPSGILLLGCATSLFAPRHGLPFALVLVLGCQGHLAFQFYRQHWQQPEHPALPLYASLLAPIPATPGGFKVYNCEWETGPYILMARPDLRFVDLLDPALLWHASRTRYMARRGLNEGAFEDPHAILRGAFKADYVLCAKPALIRQMDARPQDFTSDRASRGDAMRLFAVRPD
jgi:hypothetical protein